MISKSALLNQYLQSFEDKADQIIKKFIVVYFLFGLVLAPIYDTWIFALGIGGSSLLLHLYVSKFVRTRFWRRSANSLVFSFYMLQFIGQMHGMYEMHFFYFTNVAILIIYMDWRIVIPYTLFSILHHTFFFFLEIQGVADVGKYFINDVEVTWKVLSFHYGLAIFMSIISGYFAYVLREYRIKDYEQNQRLEESNSYLNEQQDKLSNTMGQLEARNNELDQIIYKTTHDLKSPLNSIEGIITLLADAKTEEEIKNYTAYLKSSAMQMKEFIEANLDFGKEAKQEIRISAVKVDELLKISLANLRYMEGIESIDIKTSILGKDIPFYSDAFRLQLIFSNLISNAIKYQKEGSDSHLKISASITQKELCIQVEDNGIGIPKEKQKDVFLMYERATEEKSGTGLGLFIVKQAVEKLNGTIELESILGMGTKFLIRIPNQNTDVGNATSQSASSSANKEVKA